MLLDRKFNLVKFGFVNFEAKRLSLNLTFVNF